MSEDGAADAHLRVALVTGASRGIGRAVAVELARLGHPVACGYGADADAAAETVALAEAHGAKALAVAIDIRDADAVDTAFGEVEGTLGPVEVLVNNAGITKDGLLARMSDEQWSDVVDTNLGGAFHTIRRATPKMMRARFGRIVNISSVSGHIGAPGQANYSAAKAGLLGLSRAVARELASRGITCNAVAPGFVLTELTQNLPDDLQKQITERTPLGRFGTVEEIADAVAFLVSDEARYITGQVLAVDGGLVMM